MTQIPTPEQGLREQVELELERQRSNDGDNFTRHALTFFHPVLEKRQIRHGIWNAPKISLLNPFYRTVKQVDLGRLDIISSDYYDDPRMWWAIAHVNEIKNPLTDMEVGMVLIIPRKDAVIEAIETGNRALFEA